MFWRNFTCISRGSDEFAETISLPSSVDLADPSQLTCSKVGSYFRILWCSFLATVRPFYSVKSVRALSRYLIFRQCVWEGVRECSTSLVNGSKADRFGLCLHPK